MGRGFSMPVVDNGTVYVTGSKEAMDYLTKVGPEGNTQWSVPFGSSWSKSFPDARSSPTIAGNRVVAISGGGVVACLDAESGNMLWSVDGFDKFEGRCGQWGIAESPLVVDGKVIYTPGGVLTTMVALDLESGETLWTTESLKDTSAYVAPILVEHGNKKMIIGITARYVFGVDAEDGTFLWTYRYYDLNTPLFHVWAPVINCMTPVYRNGRVYITSGYNHGGVMLELNEAGTDVSVVWNDTLLDNHHGGVVVLNDRIYGSNWIDNSNGNWCCIDWETGQTRYEKEWQTKGSIITADNRLYCYEEKRGFLALVDPNPEDFSIISKFRIREGSGPHWAHPAISDGKLIVRHGDVLMLYDIGKESDKLTENTNELKPQ
jgi:outer membrane protein assembly factor BamB